MPIRSRSFRSLFISGLLFLSLAAFGEGTHSWEQSSFNDLSRGTAKGVALRSTGGLELAPSFKALTTTPSTYIWNIAAGPSGDLFAAAGAPARIYRVTSDGKSSAIFQPQELQVQALAISASGTIFAATNPDGKIYKITPPPSGSKDSSSSSTWNSSLFFNPGTKYIWDLALDSSGNLYVATGDHGEIFRVTPGGEHSVFFKSDEAHIRVLAFDHSGNLIAGSDGSGLIYRISPKGEAFVLYSAPKKEITALAIGEDGNIFAAATGEKQASSAASPVLTPSPSQGSTVTPLVTPNALFTTANAAPSAKVNNLPSGGSDDNEGSEVYEIAPDGSPSTIWSSHDELVYALAFDAHNHLIAGAGNRGHIFAIHGKDDYTELLQASASQVTSFSRSGAGLYAATSNLGKIYQLDATANTEGAYESDVFDAHNFSRWGRLQFRGNGKVDLFARTGNVDNPDRNWSPWQHVSLGQDGSGPIPAPSARFIQWKAQLQSGTPAPELDSVIVNYLPKNVAPDFDDVTVQTGAKYQFVPQPAGAGGAAKTQQHFDVVPPAIHDPGSVSVRWAVHDDNGDDMTYSIYYRGDNESRWLLLKEGLSEKFYSFDASLLPDGGYKIKVVASDAPSHSPGEGLRAERESGRFEVDTTPPRIEGLTASQSGDQIRVQFRATDTFSNIRKAEYSLDAGDWQYIDPVDQLSDSLTENYDFRVPVPALSAADSGKGGGATEHVIVVRAYDSFENLSSAKFVLKKSAEK